MHKNLLLVGIDDFICDNFLRFVDKKVLCLSDNLVYLEKRKKDLVIYPFNSLESEIVDFFSVVNNKSYFFNEVMFNINYFSISKPITQINVEEITLLFELNFKFFFILIKKMIPNLKSSFNIFITFLINQTVSDKNNFLYQQSFVNTLLFNFMTELNKEFSAQGFYFNCISLENINLVYRKNIYPYRHFKIKNEKLHDVYNFLLKKKLRNKIIVC